MALLPEDLGSSTHMTAHNHLQLQSSGINSLFWNLWDQAHKEYKNIQAEKHPYT